MTTMHSLLITVGLLFLFRILPCSYRHVTLSSPEVCPLKKQSTLSTRASKLIQLEHGSAMVLTMSNIKLPFWKCDLDIKASPGYGLMVRVEEAKLRESSKKDGKCEDYLQLGNDDNIPFFTLEKSKKLCGDISSYSYDVSNGQLLVWVRLGRLDEVEAKLTLVITQYKKSTSEDLTKHRSCNSGSHWVSLEYFCDGRVNCAKDLSPADESPLICKENENMIEDDSSTNSFPSGPPLNLLSIILVLVAGAFIVFVLILLVIRLKVSSTCYHGRSSSSNHSDCELPEISARLPPLGTSSASPTAAIMYLESTSSLVRGTTPDTEPPPAYQDLFPQGYKFTDASEIRSFAESVNICDKNEDLPHQDTHACSREDSNDIS